MSRITRIAIRLIAQLEGIHSQTENPYYQDLYFHRKWDQHRKVFDLQKTKKKLEEWFAAREIPIRIIYADPEHLSVIARPGVITYRYEPMLDQEPPTPWMIVHNLAHGLFDYIRGLHPQLLQHKTGPEYADWTKKTIRDINLSPSKDPDKDTGDAKKNTTYPTTRSFENDTITNNEEAFYEVFTDWVRTGHVHLQSQDEFHARRWGQRLEHYFREIVDEVAKMGVVIHNI